jgi:hypothetical protein
MIQKTHLPTYTKMYTKSLITKKIEKERKKPDDGTERNCEKTRGEVH